MAAARAERVVVVLEYNIYVYNFADLNLLHTIETVSNPKGLCSLCANPANTVLGCPGLQKGHIRVELFHITRSTLISAHESTLSCLALNTDGTRLAIASGENDVNGYPNGFGQLTIFDTATWSLMEPTLLPANCSSNGHHWHVVTGVESTAPDDAAAPHAATPRGLAAPRFHATSRMQDPARSCVDPPVPHTRRDSRHIRCLLPQGICKSRLFKTSDSAVASLR